MNSRGMESSSNLVTKQALQGSFKVLLADIDLFILNKRLCHHR